jgi:hypothetical protein
MATITHTYVSGIADGGDTTLVQPSNWNANHTVVIDEVNSVPTRLTLGGTTRLDIRGTGELTLGSVMPVGTRYLGTPKIPDASFSVADGYFLDAMYRLAVPGGMRVGLEGNADLIISDDFKTRSRIVLAGGPS